MRLPLVVEGAEEASLLAGHVLLRQVGVVLGRGVSARPALGTQNARVGLQEVCNRRCK